MLPERRPDVVEQQRPYDRNCYKHFILFLPSIAQGQTFHHPTPPRLWSRLLSRIMNTVKEVRNILNEQVTVEEELASSSTTMSEGGGSLIYWRTGLFYNVNKLTFSIESLSEIKKYDEKDGVLIVASQEAEGRKILGQLIDIVKQLISEWYPGLNGELEQRVPCIECIKKEVPSLFEFKVDQLLPLITYHKLTHKCGSDHDVKLVEIVPDLLLQDLDPTFHLDSREVIYETEKKSLLETGAFGEVYCGKYKGRAVAIKLYTANTKVEEDFRELRSESKVLQQLHHPSLVCMVGVTVHPTMSLVPLVLEEAPEGSL